MNAPQAAMLPDGRRLHLQHGPIDLIIEAWGSRSEVGTAYRQAAQRFETILAELVAELPDLRGPAGHRPRTFRGGTARRMEAAVTAHAQAFITPMAAVAGAVADEVLEAMLSGRRLAKAVVNNGGDAALHLAPGEALTLAIGGTGAQARIRLDASCPSRGVATSGWPGRSFSLGIADAVTVLARSAAAADAAATVIANAVDLPGHPKVLRQPACEIAPDSDLGDRLVTVGVEPLTEAEAAEALGRGQSVADTLLSRGLADAAGLFLQGRFRLCGLAAHDAGLLPVASQAPPLALSRAVVASSTSPLSLSATPQRSSASSRV